MELWREAGAEVNLVGSLRTGLLAKNRDIDMHIYSDPVSVGDSFEVIKRLAADPRIERVEYTNLLATEEECLEWHAWFRDRDGEVWQLDMIHINRGSRYDGVVEGVTQRIGEALDDTMREAILRIKFEVPQGVKAPGIEIYRAVISHGVRTWEEYARWKDAHPDAGPLEWMP